MLRESPLPGLAVYTAMFDSYDTCSIRSAFPTLCVNQRRQSVAYAKAVESENQSCLVWGNVHPPTYRVFLRAIISLDDNTSNAPPYRSIECFVSPLTRSNLDLIRSAIDLPRFRASATEACSCVPAMAHIKIVLRCSIPDLLTSKNMVQENNLRVENHSQCPTRT